jgi:hypothetical protein
VNVLLDGFVHHRMQYCYGKAKYAEAPVVQLYSHDINPSTLKDIMRHSPS